jgi:hypothetical protein
MPVYTLMFVVLVVGVLALVVWSIWRRRPQPGPRTADQQGPRFRRFWHRFPPSAFDDSERLFPQLLSMVLVAAALAVIFGGDHDIFHQHFAYGTIGTIVGYWLPHR